VSNQLNLEKVFESYDQNPDKQLTFDEFSKMMLDLDGSLKSPDIKAIFDIFDDDKNDAVSYAEFKLVLRNQQPGKKPISTYKKTGVQSFLKDMSAGPSNEEMAKSQ